MLLKIAYILVVIVFLVWVSILINRTRDRSTNKGKQAQNNRSEDRRDEEATLLRKAKERLKKTGVLISICFVLVHLFFYLFFPEIWKFLFLNLPIWLLQLTLLGRAVFKEFLAKHRGTQGFITAALLIFAVAASLQYAKKAYAAISAKQTVDRITERIASPEREIEDLLSKSTTIILLDQDTTLSLVVNAQGSNTLLLPNLHKYVVTWESSDNITHYYVITKSSEAMYLPGDCIQIGYEPWLRFRTIQAPGTFTIKVRKREEVSSVPCRD